MSWVYVIVGIALMISIPQTTDPSDRLFIALFMIFYGGVLIWNRYDAGPRMAKQFPDTLSDELLIITDAELQSQTSDATLIVKWEGFVHATVSEDMVLFYVNRMMFLIYPKRFFSEEEFSFLKAKAELCAAKSQLSKTPIRSYQKTE
jgi:hypothetical protein